MKIQVRNNCSEFNSYRAARVKSLFNCESGANFAIDADLPLEDQDWKIGVVVGPSGSGKTSIGRSIWPDVGIYDGDEGWQHGTAQDEALATWEPSIDRPPAHRPDLLMIGGPPGVSTHPWAVAARERQTAR